MMMRIITRATATKGRIFFVAMTDFGSSPVNGSKVSGGPSVVAAVVSGCSVVDAASSAGVELDGDAPAPMANVLNPGVVALYAISLLSMLTTDVGSAFHWLFAYL